MKSLFHNKIRVLIGSIAIIFILNIMGYLFNFKYVSITKALSEVNKYEVRSDLLMDALNEVGVFDPKEAALLWGSGLKKRNAALQYAVMSSDLKKQYVKQLDETSPNWVTGMSSPWIDDYNIVNIKNINSNQLIINMRFITKSSTGYDQAYTAKLTLKRENKFWRIIKIDMDQGLYPYTGFIYID
ncbi:MAG: hypothetical protein PHD10_00910 [Bacilli bacterium]|nr:hypothetical protein [Bacilli bacterium]MDD4607681.1 hypothetical protein [Bacilli bacterium]